MTREQAIKVMRKAQGDLSLRGFAFKLGLSAAYLSDVYRGNRSLGPALCRHLGLKAITTTETRYERVK